MQLIRKLLFRNRSQPGRNQKIRGLSTAELVGIIVIVGILGALGGTYISGLIGASKTNTGTQNAQSLNTVMASALAAGATAVAGSSAGNIDVTSSATAIAELCGAGVTVGTPPVTYRMNPSVGTPGSYTLSPLDATGTWSYTAGAAP